MPEASGAPYLLSAGVFGRCGLMVDGPEAEYALRRLAAKYYPDAETIEAELAHAGRAVQVFEITVEHLSGKQIQEK